MAEQDECKICGYSGVKSQIDLNGGRYTIACLRCGHYRIIDRAMRGDATTAVVRRKHLLSGLLRNVWETIQEEFLVTAEMMSSWEAILKAAPILIPADTDVAAKANAILRHIRRRSEFPGDVVILSEGFDPPVGFCRNEREFSFCLGYLVQQGFAEHLARRACRRGTIGLLRLAGPA